ncbi:threonine synthase [[Eubacterium] cellulosolvens]
MNYLKCTKCSNQYSLDKTLWRCECGGVLDIIFDASFPIKKITKREKNIWRYREALPINNNKNIVSFNEGFTPLVEINFYGTVIQIKQEQLFTTGSYKDRGAAVLISKVKELGIEKVVEDSSGNAGSAIAAYCARAGIGCDIFVPTDTSSAKLNQIEMYGANLNKISGSREETAKAVLIEAQQNNLYYASHSWNPFFFQGTKTVAYEICEQLEWSAPDTFIVPVGNGTLLLGAFIGFNELFDAGLIDNVPKLIGIQASNCAPLQKAFQNGLKKIPKIDKQETVAEGIAIAEPIRGNQILNAVKVSDGEFIAVDDSEILNSLKYICEKGFYIEPTAAATTAGINKYLEDGHSDELIISVLTGHGLKATDKMMKIISSKKK